MWRDNNLRKILMRSAMPLGEDKNISEVLIHNLVGDNTGNLLFQNSVARVIMTEDTEITTINVKRKFSQEEIDRFNSEYEMFLIPLANAFRISFIDQFRYLTDLVERLTIPCVVIGIGIQRNLDATAWNYPYDEAATEFVKAVLNKSEIIGIRGELTAEYLKRHGFSVFTPKTAHSKSLSSSHIRIIVSLYSPQFATTPKAICSKLSSSK